LHNRPCHLPIGEQPCWLLFLFVTSLTFVGRFTLSRHVNENIKLTPSSSDIVDKLLNGKTLVLYLLD
jgi:hypothetical protein